MAGKSIINLFAAALTAIVCGDSEFSDAIRGMVIKAMDDNQNVEFVETEFQPQGVPQAYPGIHKLDTSDIEMGSFKNLERRRLVKPRFGRRRLVKSRFGRRRTARQARDDREILIEMHSGVSGKLRTLDEEVNRKDSETDVGAKIEPKEVV